MTSSRFREPAAGRLACIALVIAAALGGRAPARGGVADDEDAAYRALLVDGREVAGRLAAIGDARVAIATKDGKTEDLPFERLVKVTRESSGPAVAAEASLVVLLGDGDRLMRASIGTATDASLELRTDVLGRFDLPIDCVLGLVLAPPEQGSGLENWLARLRDEPRSSEVVWLNNGDRIAGSFLGMDDRSIKLQVDQKPLEIDRGGVVAIGFDPKLLNYPRPEGPYLEATLGDGTRIGLTSARLVDGGIEARTRFGKPVRFPVSELVRLHARSKSLVYLSERRPARAQYEEYVGPTLPFRLDHSVDGHPMRIGGQTYDRGIGTQSRTLLAYRIEPGDRRFQALVGVDERAGPLGSVVFRVFVDRQERFKSDPMTDRDPPKALDIDLSGGKILILATEFGHRGNIRDLADWAEARIIR